MTHLLLRGAALMLLVVSIVSFLLLQRTINLPETVIGSPATALPNSHSNRPFQKLYQLEAQSAREGWTSDRLRMAGDLWREMGDLTRAVPYWEAAAPDATVLRDRAQAYLEL